MGTTISNFISEMNAKKLPQEKEIVKNVARCGKQLGCINSALNALIPLVISHADATELKQNVKNPACKVARFCCNGRNKQD